MKTPEEIKKGIVEAIEEVSWVVEGGDAHDLQDACDKAHASMADALNLIEQLEADACNWEIEATLLKSRIAQYESQITRCADCKHSAIDAYSNRRMCIRNGEIKPNGRIWFGVAVNDDHFCGYGEPPKE